MTLTVVVPLRSGAELRVTLSPGDEYVITSDPVATRFAELAAARAEPFARGARSFADWKQAIVALTRVPRR